MKRRVSRCLLICLILLLTVSPIANAYILDFDDVQAGAWYHSYVQSVCKMGLFNGTGERTFSPDACIKRADFVMVLGRLYEKAKSTTIGSTDDYFIDVDEDAYYFKYVNWAAHNEIVSGYGDGVFAPEDYITREQMATILHNYMLKTDSEPEEERGGHYEYNDFMSISDWAREAVYYLTDYSIMHGSELYFKPNDFTTRAEATAVFARVCYLITDWGEYASL